ncbi:hypothetical protein TRV_02571 [Trichophyton verrucosum HKI 0517]|uniref:Uncharacterized protein n=1 Tax=Trichophyton verrucosum (strain HKI 0517) TaxID=663202 RepID=D4D648_TRIVH|nr:uncharacterized protein TRV_02571 [Trichophyton verrucosum HKI 0517]EFE42679.1 hypothetical protein TRV_02571 [Trichophyton verrucosum HKI 0517]
MDLKGLIFGHKNSSKAAKQQSSQLFLPVWSIHLAAVEDVSISEKRRKYQKRRPRKTQEDSADCSSTRG